MQETGGNQNISNGTETKVPTRKEAAKESRRIAGWDGKDRHAYPCASGEEVRRTVEGD